MTGQQLKELRTKYKLTQKQIADDLGVVQSRISEWESGLHEISKAYRKILDMYFKGLEKK